MQDSASLPSTPAGRKTTTANKAGPSTPNAKSTPGTNAAAGPGDSDDEGDEEMVDLNAMKAFAKQVQQAPSTPFAKAPSRVVIPKRGEKDFEPLNETQTIQEKMLRESRQALFDGLSGVRGTSSKHMSHAIWIPSQSPNPQVKVIKGQAFLTMGHTIRPSADQVKKHIELKTELNAKGKGKDVPALKSNVELLPEEALYLLERGSLQIWQPGGGVDEELKMEFDEDTQTFSECTEVTVMEGFARFVGMDGLSMERYQVYAGLRRLGYTVQRVPQFLPHRFRKQPPINPGQTGIAPIVTASMSGSLLQSFMSACRRWASGCMRLPGSIWRSFARSIGRIVGAVLGRRRWGDSGGLWNGAGVSSYGALYEKLRIIPAGHSHPVTISPSTASTTSANEQEATEETNLFAPLVENPYLPFYHVWKPNTHWTMAKWDKASPEGLEAIPPAFWIGVVDARSVPFPTLPQMTEVFDIVPEVPKPYLRRRAPPAGTPLPEPAPASSTTATSWVPGWLKKVFGKNLISKQDETPQVNTFLSLKQGDRTIIVAVVDGGNVGWTRLGRGGFEEHLMVPHGW